MRTPFRAVMDLRTPFRAVLDLHCERQRRISRHVARLCRFYPSLPAESLTVLAIHEADREAIAGDMQRVGDGLRRVLGGE